MSAPEWPRKHGDVQEIRESAEASAGLGVQEIVDHYEGLINDLDQPRRGRGTDDGPNHGSPSVSAPVV